jgi:ammonia channel protein AmtB
MFYDKDSLVLTVSMKASISGPGDGSIVARAVVNTLIGCCTSGTVVLFVNKLMPGGKWSIVKLINGCLAGDE